MGGGMDGMGISRLGAIRNEGTGWSKLPTAYLCTAHAHIRNAALCWSTGCVGIPQRWLSGLGTQLGRETLLLTIT